MGQSYGYKSETDTVSTNIKCFTEGDKLKFQMDMSQRAEGRLNHISRSTNLNGHPTSLALQEHKNQQKSKYVS